MTGNARDHYQHVVPHPACPLCKLRVVWPVPPRRLSQ